MLGVGWRWERTRDVFSVEEDEHTASDEQELAE